MDDAPEIVELCPPHNFRAAWATESIGRIFCTLCGDVRLMEPVLPGVTTKEVIHARKEAPDNRTDEGGQSGRGSRGR